MFQLCYDKVCSLMSTITQFYFATPKSVTVSSMSYMELLQFHQTRRIHHKQSGKLVKFVAQITFSLTSPELSPLFGNKAGR